MERNLMKILLDLGERVMMMMIMKVISDDDYVCKPVS
jgi:hypothetical protein